MFLLIVRAAERRHFWMRALDHVLQFAPPVYGAQEGACSYLYAELYRPLTERDCSRLEQLTGGYFHQILCGEGVVLPERYRDRQIEPRRLWGYLSLGLGLAALSQLSGHPVILIDDHARYTEYLRAILKNAGSLQIVTSEPGRYLDEVSRLSPLFDCDVSVAACLEHADPDAIVLAPAGLGAPIQSRAIFMPRTFGESEYTFYPRHIDNSRYAVLQRAGIDADLLFSALFECGGAEELKYSFCRSFVRGGVVYPIAELKNVLSECFGDAPDEPDFPAGEQADWPVAAPDEPSGPADEQDLPSGAPDERAFPAAEQRIEAPEEPEAQNAPAGE